MSKHLVMVSGGIDSIVMLNKVVKEYPEDEVVALTLLLNDPKAMKQELKIVKYWTEKLNVMHKMVDMRSMVGVLNNISPESVDGSEVTDAMVRECEKVRRNRFLQIFGCFVANAHKFDCVWFGTNKDDVERSDQWCSETFMDNMETLFVTSYNISDTNSPLEILTPFWNMSKADVIKEGTGMKVNMGKTWSCYFNGRHHCGTCDGCIARKKMFADLGLEKKDKVKYESDMVQDENPVVEDTDICR